MKCASRDCDKELLSTNHSGHQKKYCCEACGGRERRKQRQDERADRIVMGKVEEVKAELKEKRKKKCRVDISQRDVERIIKLSQQGWSNKKIGQQLHLGADSVSEWRKMNPTECEIIPEVEIYDDLHLTWCDECKLETFMWVLQESKDHMHLYCPDCQHNQNLIHPRALNV